MLTLLLLTALLLALCHAPFVWWGFVLTGLRVIVLPTDEEQIVVLTEDPDEVTVDVEVVE